MGHYAKVINDIVVEVVVAEKEFIDKLPDSYNYYECSYNVYGGKYIDPETNQEHKNQSLATLTEGRKRKNFPNIGFKFDRELNAFIPPTPFPSWKLNTETCLWESPVSYPDDIDFKKYIWNEQHQKWTYTGYYIDIFSGEVVKEE
jgi:hypothetical protein